MKGLISAGILAISTASAGAQAIHHGFIWLEGPEGVLAPDTTYSIEAWARWESPIFIEGTSATGGFGFDVINTLGSGACVASVGNIRIADWAAGFGSYDRIDGTDIIWISGGQIPDLFGWYPQVDHRNPIPLFTFDFTTAGGRVGDFTFAPMNPGPWGGLTFYPVSTDGFSVIAPRDPGTELHLMSWSYVIPAPGPAGMIGVAGMLGAGRRRR